MITSTAKEQKDRKTTGNEKRLEIKIKTKKIETQCRINKNIKIKNEKNIYQTRTIENTLTQNAIQHTIKTDNNNTSK